MISVADLHPPAAGALPPLSTTAADASALSWFDDAGASALRIGADPGPASRGLTVVQHADRVLGHLFGEADEA